MTKYRKRPIVVDAEQYVEEGSPVRGMCTTCPYPGPHTHTIHDNQLTPVVLGDWILPEPDGVHFYPCKADVFMATYEEVGYEQTFVLRD